MKSVQLIVPPFVLSKRTESQLTDFTQIFFGQALRGGAGSDRLIGGKGIDTLIGGKGTDFYGVDTPDDIIIDSGPRGLGISGSGDYSHHKNVVGVTVSAGSAVVNGDKLASAQIWGEGKRLEIVGPSNSGSLSIYMSGDEVKHTIALGTGENIWNDTGVGYTEVSYPGTNDMHKVDLRHLEINDVITPYEKVYTGDGTYFVPMGARYASIVTPDGISHGMENGRNSFVVKVSGNELDYFDYRFRYSGVDDFIL